MKKSFFLFVLIFFIFTGCNTELGSSGTSATTDTTPPQKISNVSAQANNKSITLTWDNPNDNDFYGTKITFSPAAQSVTQPIIVEGIPSESSNATFTGLENNTEYTFSLIALDKNQNKSNSVTIKATPKAPVDVTPPAEVNDLSIKADDKSVIIYWINPEDADFEYIQITFTPTADDILQPITIKGTPAASLNTTINGLENGVEYTFSIATFDKKHNKSNGKSIKATPKETPDTTPPGNVTYLKTEPSDKTVYLSWKNPTDNDFEHIEITFTPEVDGINQPIVISCEPNSGSSTVIQNLSNGTTYSFTLVSVDKNKNKSSGENIEATPHKPETSQEIENPQETTDVTPPAEISNLVTTSDHKRITLNWTNPTDTDFYGVEISSNPASGTLSQSQLLQCNPAEQKEFTILNLENNIEYEFTIKTIDTNGNKSIGITKKATPKESTLSLEVYLPNDNEDNITLTKDKAPIQVNIFSSHEIKKAVWRKVTEITEISDSILNSDTNILNIESNKIYFDVDENGLYDIAVENSEGVKKCIRTEVKTIIKKCNLNGITNTTSMCDGEYVYLTWTDPQSRNKYISPLQSIIISYCYNDDTSNIKTAEVKAGEEKLAIKLDDNITEYDYITLKKALLIDKLGNETLSYIEINGYFDYRQYCNPYINVGAYYLSSTIKKMTESGKIVVFESEASVSLNEITSALTKLKESNPNIQVALDLTKCKFKNSEFSYFNNCINLSYIKLPTSIETIGYDAFSGCTNLKTIDFSSSIQSIGQRAFKNCTSLERITIPNSVTSIGSESFFGCSKLSIINLSSELTNIGTSAFYGCTNLESITIPDNVIFFGENAFSECPKLKTITLPSKLTEINEGAFSGFSSLEYITMSENITSIGANAFYGCSKLKEINLPSKLTEICENTFYECSSLENMTIPENVTSIGANAFYGCSSIESIIIYENVTSIGESAFYGCSKLKTINLPTKLTAINDKLFYECTNLENITIPESVTSIGANAFYGCSNLTNINIPDYITELKDGTFCGCSGLSSLSIPETVTTIGNYTFANCKKLKSINIPTSVTKIGSAVFSGCTALKSISIPSNLMKKNLTSTPESITKITLLAGGTKINDSAFEGFSSLEDVQIPEGITTIGEKAFYNCKKLKMITLPNSITSIKREAFYGCFESTSISLAQVKCNTQGQWYKYVYPNGWETIRSMSYKTLSEGYEIKHEDI